MKKIIITIILAFACTLNTTAQSSKARKNMGSNKKTTTNIKSTSSKKTKSYSSSKKSASSKDGKFIWGIGWGAFVNAAVLGNGALYDVRNVNGINDTIVQRNRTAGNYNLVFIGLDLVYILKPLNDNTSITLSAFPVYGMGFGNSLNRRTGTLSIDVPVFVNFNSGILSNYGVRKDNGFRIGIGVQAYLAPLSNIGKPIIDDPSQDFSALYKAKSLTIMPCMQIGLSKFNSKDIAREWNLKIGYGKKKYDDPLNLSPIKKSTVFDFRLSLIKYLHY